MVELFIGKKGKGKTKYLLEDVNTTVKSAIGSVVYLDKSTSHMHELSTKARLINVTDYNIDNKDEFVGFVYGIISQDYDLESIYFDSFLKIAHIENNECTSVIEKLKNIADSRKIRMCISISVDESELDSSLKQYIKVSL